ncbi:unnamed protein product [Lampetra fluviatilis]
MLKMCTRKKCHRAEFIDSQAEMGHTNTRDLSGHKVATSHSLSALSTTRPHVKAPLAKPWSRGPRTAEEEEGRSEAPGKSEDRLPAPLRGGVGSASERVDGAACEVGPLERAAARLEHHHLLLFILLQLFLPFLALLISLRFGPVTDPVTNLQGVFSYSGRPRCGEQSRHEERCVIAITVNGKGDRPKATCVDEDLDHRLEEPLRPDHRTGLGWGRTLRSQRVTLCRVGHKSRREPTLATISDGRK